MDWIKSRGLLNPEASAQELSISRASLYRLLARGEIKSVVIGRSRRIPARELERYIDRLVSEQGGEQELA